jgi:hypothetical protein
VDTQDTSSQTWGDSILLPKPDNTFRFIFQNIQGLPIDPYSHQHHQIGMALKEMEADVFGIAEINLNFRVLGPSFQWSERFRNLQRHHSIHSFNRHNSSTKRVLFGGTGLISTGASSHRVINSGADETGMGRWVWTLFAGRNQTQLRVISGYRPNPDHSDRPGTVYSQQEKHLTSIRDKRNPRRAFIKDLEKQLDKWMND